MTPLVILGIRTLGLEEIEINQGLDQQEHLTMVKKRNQHNDAIVQ